MSAVSKNYLGAEIPTDLMESMVNELMANHSARTGLTVYGVDDFSLSHVSGTTATVLQERASERWIAWLELEKVLPWESSGGTDGKSKGDVNEDPVENVEGDVDETIENVEGDADERVVENVAVLHQRRDEAIPSLKMVIISNFGPNILEFIQIIGRLRESGLCFLLRGEGRYSSFNDLRLSAMREASLAAQILAFYKLELDPGTNPHSGSSEAFEILSVATHHLLEDVDITAHEVRTVGYLSPDLWWFDLSQQPPSVKSFIIALSNLLSKCRVFYIAKNMEGGYLFTTVFRRRGLSAEQTNICFFEQTRHLGYETKDGTSAVSSEQGKQIN